MTAEKTRELNKQLQTLDRESGLGLFPNLERKIADGEKFLIVSYGGTGADVLNSLKDNLSKDLSANDIDQNVRILSIDTDKNTKYKQITVRGADGQVKSETIERFTPKEFLWLDSSPAKVAINIGDPGMAPWINPALPGLIKAAGTYLDGNGASSTRQVGRLLLFPQKTVNNFESKITDLAKELTDGTTSNLNILIITGISGGTGSGTVIDATYLIRHVISKLPGNLEDKTNLCGFVLLPPTGTSENPIDVEKGNRNGYAALKEIDHYMTIARRDEVYHQMFGSTDVVSTKNLFDTCYLIDGNIVGMAFSNPREKAKEVVSDCILDIITSFPLTDDDGTSVPPIKSFMSDAVAFSLTMVGGQREQVAPREANYTYCAIGHGKVLVPVELLKSYVAGRAYNEMYKLFKNCSKPTPDDVLDFIDDIAIKDYNEQAQLAKISSEIDARFKKVSRSEKKGGPFFTANLIKESIVEVGNMYSDLNVKKLVFNKEKKLEQYQTIRRILTDFLEKYYSVYIAILDKLDAFFKVEHDTLCDSLKFREYAGTTYTYTPIDFTAQDEKSARLRSYLSDLVTNKVADELIRKLTENMVSNKAAWTELTVPKGSAKQPAFDGAALIREFWSKSVESIVKINIEDFLIKYYSGDKDACYKTEKTPEGFVVETEETVKWLKVAAAEIVEKMLGPAGISNPLAEIREYILTKENFNGLNIFLVPEEAPHLKNYIESELRTKLGSKDKILIASSSANDRISCYAQYTGIPAYMFSWTKNGESDYEKGVQSNNIGLHMSETKGGALWREYPNLVVESIWPKISNPAYYNEREHAINLRIEDIFERARKLGLAELHALSVNTNFGEYSLFALPDNYRPDTGLFKNADTEFKGTPAKLKAEKELQESVESNANRLFSLVDWNSMPLIDMDSLRDVLEKGEKNVLFIKKEMSFPGTVSTAYIDSVTTKPANWEESLASKLLRTCPDFYNDMRGTVLVMESLYRKVNDTQQAKNHLKDFAAYLAMNLFSYDENLLQWTYNDAGVEETLTELDYGNKEMKSAEYYFMFNDYLKKAFEVNEALADEVKEKKAGIDKAEIIGKQKAIKEQANLLVAEIDRKLSPDKSNPNQNEIISSQVFRKACTVRSYDTDEIIGFYKELRETLEYI